MKKVVKFKLIFFFLLLLTASCQRKQEKRLDTLNLNFQEGDLPSLHPHELMIYLRGLCLSKTLYEGLTRIDQNGKAQLCGAKNVEISSDRLHYTFFLRENKWSDGSPVTAYQYEKAWKEALSPNSACPRADILYILKNGKKAKKGEMPLDHVGVQAIDSKTLVVDLEYPSPFFLELLAQPIAAPLADAQAKEPRLFNGPFLVAEWKKGDSLHLKPNPFYWDFKNISLKRISFYMATDQETAFSLYEKKEIDWIGVPLCNLTSEQIGYLKNKGKLRTHPIDRAFWIYLNTSRPNLASASIRQALSMAIDRAAISNHILTGTKPLERALPKGLLPLSPSIKLVEDIEASKEKFEKGLSELGFTKNTFPPLEISYAGQANRKQVAEYLQQVWSQSFGVKVILKPQEWNVLRSDLGKGNFDVSASFEAAYYNDPIELMERMTSLNPGNFSRWTNRQFEEKIRCAQLARDPHERMKYLSQAEEILLEELPFIPVSSDVFLFDHRLGLKNYVFDSVGAVDFSRSFFLPDKAN